jgi:hypothetical protein
MSDLQANLNLDQRRGIRRTALIMGTIALTIFVLFFVQQAFWR